MSFIRSQKWKGISRKAFENLPPGNYLVSMFEEGHRIWNAKEEYGQTTPETTALFERLNEQADAEKAAALAETEDDDA